MIVISCNELGRERSTKMLEILGYVRDEAKIEDGWNGEEILLSRNSVIELLKRQNGYPQFATPASLKTRTSGFEWLRKK